MSETPNPASRWSQRLGRGAMTFLTVLGSLRRIAVATRLYDELARYSDRDLAGLGTSREDIARFVVDCIDRSIDNPEFVPDVVSVKAAARRPAVDAAPAVEPLRRAA